MNSILQGVEKVKKYILGYKKFFHISDNFRYFFETFWTFLNNLVTHIWTLANTLYIRTFYCVPWASFKKPRWKLIMIRNDWESYWNKILIGTPPRYWRFYNFSLLCNATLILNSNPRDVQELLVSSRNPKFTPPRYFIFDFYDTQNKTLKNPKLLIEFPKNKNPVKTDSSCLATRRPPKSITKTQNYDSITNNNAISLGRP